MVICLKNLITEMAMNMGAKRFGIQMEKSSPIILLKITEDMDYLVQKNA